jgi:hypothetical protein
VTTPQIAGLVLISTAIVDAVLAFRVVGPRIPDENRRRIVQVTLLASCAGMLALGAVLWSGALG